MTTGMQEDREGIFDTIIRNKSHYQKRAYQCIKCLVTLFTSCSVAHNLLKLNPDFRNKWELAVSWLQEELERRPFGSAGTQFNYNWSPPAPSNDSSNGYYLERSQSALMTLTKAALLVPEDEKRTEETHELVATEESESPPGSSSLSSSQSQVTVTDLADALLDDGDVDKNNKWEKPAARNFYRKDKERKANDGQNYDFEPRNSRQRRMALSHPKSVLLIPEDKNRTDETHEPNEESGSQQHE